MLNNTDNKTYFYIDRNQMQDVVEYEKNAYFISKLESILPDSKFSEFLADFDKKRSTEIRTALQLSRIWLTQLFGYKGDIYVNILSHGTDAVYVSDDESQVTRIELKMFSTLKTGTNLDGSEKISVYHDGHRFWNVNDKSWKFRTNAAKFTDDCSILMIVDARTNNLVEAVYVDQTDMKTLLTDIRTNSENVVQVCYRHVKEFDHMQGNKCPIDKNKIIVDAAKIAKFVYQVTPKGSYYRTGYRYSIGKTKAETAEWLIDEAKTNHIMANFLLTL